MANITMLIIASESANRAKNEDTALNSHSSITMMEDSSLTLIYFYNILLLQLLN